MHGTSCKTVIASAISEMYSILMHYTLTLSGLALWKKLVFDYSELQAHNLKKVSVLCDARDIVNKAIWC